MDSPNPQQHHLLLANTCGEFTCSRDGISGMLPSSARLRVARAIVIALNDLMTDTHLPLDAAPRRMRFLLITACILIALAIVALSCDIIVAQAVLSHQLGGDLVKFIHLCEVFAHGLGAVTILIAMYVLDESKRRFLPRVIACVWLSAFLASLFKFCIGRWRPHAGMELASVNDTFAGWFPSLNGTKLISTAGHQVQSFPSGHTATAFGLAIGLSYVYPRGRYFFFTIATFAGLQRIIDTQHYPSDVLAGAAIAFLVGSRATGTSPLSRLFTRFEDSRGEKNPNASEESSVPTVAKAA